MIARALLFGWLFCAASVFGVAERRAVGAEPPAAESGHDAQPPLRFRRVYATADLLEDLPRDHDRLVPMPAEEFERLVAAIHADAMAGDRVAGVASARYQARLDGDRLVDGEATLEIFHEAAGEVLVPLEPWGLAVSEAAWAAAEPQPAVWGLADDGRLTVLAAQRGRLRLAWTLGGHRDEAGRVAFLLALPACGASQLLLDTPKGMTPLVEHGVVTRQSPPAPDTARWRIELGGRPRVQLRVVPDEQLEPGNRWTRLRQSMVYDFSLRGVEVSAELTLDAYGEPLRQLAVVLDPGLQLVAAQYGTTAVRWAVASPTTKAGPDRVVLQLPEPIQGTGRSLRLVALGPLVLDRRWRLPGIRPADIFWQEGTASLRVPEPLVLTQWDVRGGRQSKTGSLSGPGSGERVEVQYFAPDASVDVVLSRPQVPITLSQGTAIRLDGRQVTADVTAALEVAEGNRFEIPADLGRRWIVDSVASVPADAVDDWTVRRNAGARRLTIRMAKPLSPARPVRLTIRARRLDSPLGRNFTAADLRPVDFPDADARRRLVWIRVPESYQLRVTGADAAARVDPQTLGAADLALFAEPPRDPLFQWGRGLAGLQVSLEPQTPVYSAAIRIDADVADGVLRETYRLACKPQAARVRRLVVRFSQARQAPLRWTLGAEGENQLVATRLPPEEADNAEPSGGERWLVQLDPPRSVAFEIRASRAVALGEPLPVSLACVPEAAEQEATVVVGATGSSAVRIENHRLDPIPTETAAGDRVNPARASFRYDPDRDTSPDADAALIVSAEPPHAATASAWAWDCRLESRLAPDGTGRHLATYRLESIGKHALRLHLPPAAGLEAVRGVWVDRDRAAWRPLEDDAGAGLRVALPDGQRYPVVAVAFDTAGRSLGWLDSITPLLPEVDVPVLARHWTVWLPPGYAWRDPDPRWLPVPRDEPGWAERLFGPLGRPAARPPFDPTQGGSWSALVAAAAARPVAAAAAGAADGEVPGPWAVAPSAEVADRGTAGWTACQIELAAGEPVHLRIVHEDTLQAVGWAVLLGTLALAWWLAVDRLAVLVTAGGALGLAALVLPGTYAVLASHALLGVLATLGFRLIRRRSEVDRSGVDDREEGSLLVRAAAQAGVLALAIVFTLVLCASAWGRQPETPASPAPTEVYNVFIPVDEADAPTGEMYEVPETFYNALHRRATAATGEPQGWLLEAATYRGVLSWQAAGDRLVLDELTATFDLRVFGPRRSVALPLGGEALPMAPEGAMLNGRPVEPRWLEHPGLLAVDVEGDRPHSRLELSLRPTVQTDGTHTGFDLRIPPMAGSRLELVVPADAPAIEVLSAAGPVLRQDDPARVTAQLGPSDRLSVRWPERGGRAAGSSAADVEELLWLKIQDGSAVLESRFRFSIAQGYLSRLELSADPRLRLMPREGSNLAVSESEPAAGQPRTIRFTLPQPTSEPVVLAAGFLLTETSGVGNLRLPHLAARDARCVKRWVAVSVDPSLEASWSEPTKGLERLAGGAFEAAWGPASPEPRVAVAYALPPGETTWSVTTCPKPTQTAAQQSLALSFDEGQIEADFSAQLTTTDGYRFQYRVAAPTDLEVESVSLRADAAEQVARWSRGQDGDVTIFLTGPVSGPQELRLRGRLDVANRTRMPLPVVRLEGMQTESGTIELFRQPAVGLKLTQTEGLEEVENPGADPRHAASGRLVGAFAFEGPAPIGGSVAVLPNHPRVRAEQATLVRVDGESWEAEVTLRLDVEQGVLDELRLDVPAEFAGPYQLDPAEVVQQPAGTNGLLVVRPRSVITGRYLLKIRSPLKFGVGDRVRVPRVVLEAIPVSRQVVVLPTHLPLKSAVWERHGLRKIPLPEGVISPPVAPGSFAGYRVKGPEFTAILRPVQGIAEVDLADVRLGWQADGSCFGEATFDVEPAALGECVLTLPAGLRLVTVAVADVPAPVVPAGKRRWQVPLGPARYPRRIEVLFSGTLPPPDADGRWRPEAPRIEGLPVRRALWTISGPSMDARGQPEGLGEATWLEQTRLRLEHVRHMIELVGEVPSDEPGGAEHWYSLWGSRFAGLCRAVQHPRQGVEGAVPATAEAWAPLVSTDGLPPQVAAVVESATSDEGAKSRPTGSRWSDRADAFWWGPRQAARPPVRCVTEEGMGPVTLVYRPIDAGWARRRWAAPAVLALLTLLAVWGVRSGLIGAVFSRWPHAVGVVAGLAWWLWLWPSPLGLAMMAVSLLASLRSGWKTRRASGSVIVPVSSIKR